MLTTVVSTHSYRASFLVPSAIDCFKAATGSGFAPAGAGCCAVVLGPRPSIAAITAATETSVRFMVVTSIGIRTAGTCVGSTHNPGE